METTELMPTAPTEKTAFHVTDEASAGWVVRKLAGIRAEQDRVKKQAEQRQAELKADYEALMYRFGGELEQFARAEADRRRRRTITLLDGSLCLRRQAARLVIADEEAAFCEARTACPDAVQTITKLDATTYRKWAEEQIHTNGGEVPAGCAWMPEAETFAVKFAADKGE